MSNNFFEYFKRIQHSSNTRGNNSLLRIEKVRSENGRKSFKVAGALTFNDLPVKIRNETSITKLKHF